ncbi:calcium-binding protein [Methylopila musalis]|uniref:Calcium-binding protein n=1 Tax=Methylopila musalis TaxID=1134781 RepID=A0ABW3Z9V5_9HYPH
MQPRLLGTSRADYLRGDFGSTTPIVIYGLKGDDHLVSIERANDAVDDLYGGQGADRLELDFFSVTTRGVFDGGTGYDTLAITGPLINVTDADVRSIEAIELSGSSHLYVSLSQLDDVAFARALALSGAGGSAQLNITVGSVGASVNLTELTFTDWAPTNVVAVWGSAQNDTFVGSRASDIISGGAGNDSFYWSPASTLAPKGDGLSGGDGDDTFFVSGARDPHLGYAEGGAGIDTLSVTATSVAFSANLTESRLESIEKIVLGGNDATVRLELLGSQIGGTGVAADALVSGGGAGSATLRVIAGPSAPAGGAPDVDLSGLRFTSWSQTGVRPDQVVIAGGDRDDHLIGSSQADRIYGGRGADRMEGGLGNDRYFVDNAKDVVIEAAHGGRDVVETSVSYRLTNGQVEDLRVSLDGFLADIDLTGNKRGNFLVGGDGDNVLKGLRGKDNLLGGDGDDVLHGGAHADVLTGGAGKDIFVFDTALGSIDVIKDFSHAHDAIALDDAIFTAFANGRAGSAEIYDHLFYDAPTGYLYYDADGAAGPGARVAFAKLTAGLTDLDASDVLIV